MSDVWIAAKVNHWHETHITIAFGEDGFTEASWLAAFRAWWYRNPELHHLIDYAVIQTDDSGTEDVFRYKVVPNANDNEGTVGLVTFWQSSDAGRRSRIASKGKTASSEAGHTLQVDTSSSLDPEKYPGHVALAILVQNKKGSALEKGELLIFSSVTTDERDHVIPRASATDPPALVALEDADDDAWFLAAYGGFCDVLVYDSESTSTDPNATWYAHATDQSAVSITESNYPVGVCIGGYLDSNTTVRLRLGLSVVKPSGVEWDTSPSGDMAVLSKADGSLIESTLITKTELEYLNGASSNIQTQLGVRLVKDGAWLGTNVLIAGAGYGVATGAASSTELGYLSGVTSGIQGQLDALEPAWEDTSTGADGGTWTGHTCAYLTLNNESSATINAGDLVCYDDTTTAYVQIKARDSQDEIPFGVALEEIEDAASGKVGIYGFCDVNVYTDTWTDQDGERTVGEISGSQNAPLFCSYVRGSYEKAIIDGFFGSSSYEMTGYGHPLGVAVSEVGSGYSAGKARVRLGIGVQTKEPLAPMTFGGDVTLWLANFETDLEPADAEAVASWEDLSPWSNDVAQTNGSWKPAYERDSVNRHGALDFEASNYSGLETDDQDLHDNAGGLSVFVVNKQETAATHQLISKYDSSADGRGWWFRATQFIVFEDKDTYAAGGSVAWTNTDTTNFLLSCGVWAAGGNVRAYQNGTLKGTSLGTITDIGATSACELRVGAYRHDQAENYDGKIAEVAALKIGVDATERGILEDYFNDRHKLGI